MNNIKILIFTYLGSDYVYKVKSYYKNICRFYEDKNTAIMENIYSFHFMELKYDK